jgi:hypothetical protein
MVIPTQAARPVKTTYLIFNDLGRDSALIKDKKTHIKCVC